MPQAKRRYRGRCPKTGKRRFKDQLDVLLDNMRNPRTIRAYRCEFCGDYHATSKPQRGEEAA